MINNHLIEITDIIVLGGVKKYHLIGFSLGAHMLGFTAKQFLKITGAKIDRISGLDPAGPCYYKLSADKRLDKGDANFVDIIHTDYATLGISSSIGKCFIITLRNSLTIFLMNYIFYRSLGLLSEWWYFDARMFG